MHAELASLNHCAVPYLSRAGVNFYWYYYSHNGVLSYQLKLTATPIKRVPCSDLANSA